MLKSQFERFAAQGYNRIPVYRSVLADLDTPLSLYLKLADLPYSYLFESVEGGESWNRYSIMGLPARERIHVRGNEISRYRDGECVSRESVDNPLAAVKAIHEEFAVPEVADLPRFSGGLVGYFGYNTVGFVEPRLANPRAENALDVDDIVLMVSDEVAVLDNLSGRLFMIVNVDPAEPNAWSRAQQRLDSLSYRLRLSAPAYPEFSMASDDIGEDDFVSGFTHSGFKKAVEKCKEYICAGDAMQIVLSQRMTIPFRARPIDVYRALRSLNPSPYMFFMDLGDTQVVGSSPEILVRAEDGEAVVRPLAGTRPRGKTPEQDAQLAEELLADEKECAEHLMLIDLGRNDIGRIAQTGSVQVTDQMSIERYSHVMHIVSQVTGQLKLDCGPFEALAATFPAGTLSGAPKVRAMEIIDELEPVQRGVYAGSVGYIGWQNDMDMAIAIRTAVIKDGALHVQAGAGIVADSDPETEWQETMNKGRALFRAVAQATRGI